jgi:ABC-type hemin transport system substrate-binding protein
MGRSLAREKILDFGSYKPTIVIETKNQMPQEMIR